MADEMQSKAKKDQSANNPANNPANNSTNNPANNPANNSTNQSKNKPANNSQNNRTDQPANKPKNRRKILTRTLAIVLSLALLVAIGLGIYTWYGQNQLKKLQTMTFEEMIALSTQDRQDARISVGIIRGPETEITVYGENAQVIPTTNTPEHTYEIGSITKTFTASMICKALSEGKLSLEEPVSSYLPLEAGAATQNTYPTIQQVLTHTAGYPEYYLEWPFVKNFFRGGNPFTGVTQEMILAKAAHPNSNARPNSNSNSSSNSNSNANANANFDQPFLYSNFGYAVLGSVLETIYGKDYDTLANEFAADDLGLANTRVSDGTGDLEGYWQWEKGDAYASAGVLVSTISDMVRYTQLHMSNTPAYLELGHEQLVQAEDSNPNYIALGIRIDGIGASWMLDDTLGTIWHNGATGEFNSYLAFSPEKQVGVIILANQSPEDRVPSTVMGVKLLEQELKLLGN